MITFPNAKINLGLNVVNKRDDGFHNIETVFYPVALTDILEIITPKKGKRFELTCTGNTLPTVGDNICEKAFNLIKEKFSSKIDFPNVQIQLHKIIPAGAGLGGGSADAAFVLKSLNSLLKLNLDNKTLASLAAQLGSDCPFFIENKPAFAQGRGTELTPVEINLSGYFILFVFPPVPVSTAWAYSEIKPKKPKKILRDLITQDINTWKATIHNDFEVPVFYQYPMLKVIKEMFYESGALYASLSGSGSVLYGIYDKEVKGDVIFEGWETKLVRG